MTEEQPEKRREQRIKTVLPVFLKNAQGITRDVSASGVYFWISEFCCAPGEQIDFEVELRRPAGTLRLKCQGDVIRTEVRSKGTGVAVRIVESAMELAEKLEAEGTSRQYA
jgi:hypothetical protein